MRGQFIPGRQCDVKDSVSGFGVTGKIPSGARAAQSRFMQKNAIRVKIECFAFGERGELQFAWKQPGMTLDKVKEGCWDAGNGAAAALGAEIESSYAGDYPLRLTGAHTDRLIDIYREVNLSFELMEFR